MLLPRTLQLESSTIHDGVINAVVDSDNPMKDFISFQLLKSWI